MSDFNNDNPKLFNKQTVLAVILSVIVIVGMTTLTQILFPSQPLPVEPTIVLDTVVSAPEAGLVAPQNLTTTDLESALVDTAEFAIEAPTREQTYTVNTSLFTARFTNKGGNLVSLVLNDHADKSGPVEMFLTTPEHSGTFSLGLGGNQAALVEALMNVSQPGPGIIEFQREFVSRSSSGETTRYMLRKRFTFRDDEYLFKLEISLENSRPEALRIGGDGFAYTLHIGPQIGPEYTHLPKQADWRKLISYIGGKRKVINAGRNPVLEGRPSWVAITGKYFALIAIPDATAYVTNVANTVVNDYAGETSVALSRPMLGASAQTDVFYFYAGPKDNEELARYDDVRKNGFNLTGSDLEAAMEGRGILSWLETLLKWGLNLFYMLIPNYGVAIILLTLLVRAVLFPLTFKGSKATAKMQEMQPLMNELREKYKNNPQRLNKEMAEFYQKNGNPLAGCLPTLLQLPIFIAMYSLFNNHFDLRGADFVGWINDLSLADAIYTFQQPINLVIWKLAAIRGLPIIYLGSQLLYGVFMQQPAAAPGQSQGQMKFMLFGMPIMLFFMMYNVPSGLLVYWIASNIMAIAQQLVIKRMMHKHRAEILEENRSGLKLVNPKNGKNGKIKR